MGLLRDGIRGGIGAALGAGNANNGLGHSVFNKNGGPPDQTKNPYSSYATPSPRRSPYGSPAPDDYQRNSPPRDAYRNYDDQAYNDRQFVPPTPPRRYDDKRDADFGYSERRAYEKHSSPSSYNDPQRSYANYNDPRYSAQPPSYDSVNRSNDFRPFALPQMQAGDGQPFMRAYSSEIQSYGISETAFIAFLDDLNVAMQPNPEIQIFQKAANIAGWFIPGAGSLGLVGGQILVGVGGAIGKKTAVSKCLANANLALFLPAGLEVATCTVKDVNQAAGFDPATSAAMYGYRNQGFGPMGMIQAYGNSLAQPDIQTRIPLTKTGRQDPIAMLGHGLANREQSKNDRKAAKRGNRGQQNQASGSDVKWLLVRQASPESTAVWQNTLSAARQEEANAQREGRPPM